MSGPASRPLMARAAQLAVRERGYAAEVTARGWNWWPGDELEHSPELLWPLSLQVYDEMRRGDAQISSVLRAVTHPVRRTPWRIDPNGASDVVVEHVANDLGLPIFGASDTRSLRSRDRFSWADHLRHALLMLVYGHSIFEQIYRVDDNNQVHLRKLSPRMPMTIDRFNVATDGGLNSIQQIPLQGGSKPIVIPISRLVVYVNEREAGNWIGRSLLRPAYKNWLLKDRLLRIQTTSLERNGVGLPVYSGSEHNQEAGKDAEIAELDAGMKIATAVRGGDSSGVAVPNGAELSLKGVEGQVPDALPAIKYHDEQIARAVLAHFLNLGTQTGSWALGSTFADFFTQSLQAVAQAVADVATAHIVEDLVDLNYGIDEPAPRLVFDEIGAESLNVAQALKTLVDANVLTPDPGLEKYLRNAYDLPPAQNGTS